MKTGAILPVLHFLHSEGSHPKPVEAQGTDTLAEILEKAGVEDGIHFQTQELKDFSTAKKYGYIISNPPYGERLSDTHEVEKLYKKMGEVFREHDTWSTYFITSHENFEKNYGKKATKNRKLYNGKLKCYFYQFHGPRPPRK